MATSMRAPINAHLEVLQDKLKNYHSNLGTLRSKEALAERKRACRMLVLLTEGDQNLVKSLTKPLPLAEVENNYSEEEGEAEEQDLLMKPGTPSYRSTPKRRRSVLATVSLLYRGISSTRLSSRSEQCTIARADALRNVNDLAISEELLRTCAIKRRKDLPTSQDRAKNLL